MEALIGWNHNLAAPPKSPESLMSAQKRFPCFCRERMEALIGWNTKLAAIGKSDAPAFVKQLQKLPIYERFAKNLLQVRVSRNLKV